jgi:hypothetical protein
MVAAKDITTIRITNPLIFFIMEQIISGLWSLNTREKWKTFVMFVLGAVLSALYQAIQPVAVEFFTTWHFNSELFGTVVSWNSMVTSAIGAASAYFVATGASGKTGKILKK